MIFYIYPVQTSLLSTTLLAPCYKIGITAVVLAVKNCLAGVIQFSGRRITLFTPFTEPVPKNMAQIGKEVF